MRHSLRGLLLWSLALLLPLCAVSSREPAAKTPPSSVAMEEGQAAGAGQASEAGQASQEGAERASEPPPDGVTALVRLLGEVPSEAVQEDLLTGMLAGLAGRPRVTMPDDWPPVYARLRESERLAVRERALELALRFRDPRALETLRRRALDAAADPADRRRAIESLASGRDEALPDILLQLLDDPAVVRAVLRGLAEFDHPKTAAAVLAAYPRLEPPARQDALQTLASRKPWARRLLDAVESEQIARRELTAYTVRQLHSLGDEDLSRRLHEAWGRVQETSAEKRKQIDQHERQLRPERLAGADLAAGRQLFRQTCGGCHRLFGEGTLVGPDITGAQRSNLRYLLENIIDPNAAVARDFQMEVLATTGGRVITGLVVAEEPQAVTVQTVNEKIVVPSGEIDQRRKSPLSLMPEGLLRKLSPDQIRDLLAYLSSPAPLPPSDEHAPDQTRR